MGLFMKSICCKVRVFVWTLAFLVQASGNLNAATVNLQTDFKVFIPESWYSDTCSEAIYDGPLETLFLPTLLGGRIVNSWMASETSPAINDPAGNRLALKITALSNAQVASTLRIEGMRTTIESVQRKIVRGEAVRVTEFPKCAQNDPSLELVQLVNFDLFGRKISVNLESHINLIRKDASGSCSTFRNNSLSEIIHMYLPNFDLSSLEARVSMRAGGVSTTTGELVTKSVYITFYKGLQQVLEISIGTQSEMSYDVVKKLEEPSGLLQLAGARECFQPEVGMLWASAFSIRKL